MKIRGAAKCSNQGVKTLVGRNLTATERKIGEKEIRVRESTANYM